MDYSLLLCIEKRDERSRTDTQEEIASAGASQLKSTLSPQKQLDKLLNGVVNQSDANSSFGRSTGLLSDSLGISPRHQAVTYARSNQ